MIVGIGTYAIDFLTFSLLVLLGVNYLAADILNLPLELAFNYLGHRLFTFYSPESAKEGYFEKKELGRYLLNVLVQGVIGLSLLFIMVDLLELSPIVSKATQLVILPVINYLFLKKFVFIEN
jgi:putative flippase GtrA